MKKQLSHVPNLPYFKDLENVVSKLSLKVKTDRRNIRFFEHDHFNLLQKIYTQHSGAKPLNNQNFNLTTYAWAEEFVSQFCQDPTTALKIDWDYIEYATTLLYDKLKKLLRDKFETPEFEKFINFSINSLENYLLFGYNNPNNENNPWLPILQMLFEKGHLAAVDAQNGDLFLWVVAQNFEMKAKNISIAA